MKKLLLLPFLFFLLACGPPMLEHGGWAWDPSPSNPVTVDNSTINWPSDAIWGAVNPWNGAAGTTLFTVVNDPNANITFSPLSPICANGNCNDRRGMWVQRFYSGEYVYKCIIHYDPFYFGGSTSYWNSLTIAHELGHCLDYPDVFPPTSYEGVMSYYAFYDPNWRATHWFGPDDREMLLRDGYGP